MYHPVYSPTLRYREIHQVSRTRVPPLPSGGKLDEACLQMFVWLCFHLLTSKNFLFLCVV